MDTTQLIAEPGSKIIVITRTLDAPRELVFEVWTKPEHIARWWGPREEELIQCDMDFRVGGTYRFVTRGPDGLENPFKGEYLEIKRPERLVSTFIYDVEAFRDFVATDTLVLEQRDGITTITITEEHQTVAARDGHIESGMERGMRESFERLDDLLETLKSG